MIKFYQPLLGILIFLTINVPESYAGNRITINNDPANKIVIIGDESGKLTLRLNYSKGCFIDELNLNGKNTLAPSGIFTSIKSGDKLFSSVSSDYQKIKELSANRISIDCITFGDSVQRVTEKWVFTTDKTGIRWEIIRSCDHEEIVEDMALPVWNFSGLSVWKGGILNNGGMVWCKYLKNRSDAFGVHTNGVTFWNPELDNCLRITASAASDKYIASKFYHGLKDEFSFSQYLTNEELRPRFKLNRFVNGNKDVFAPFRVFNKPDTMRLLLSVVNYDLAFPAGRLPGIDASAVREIRNTTARYGVIDKNIMGGNGWTTNWKCLHEPFFAQIGLFVDDENYTRNFSSTLDQERDLATTKEGRVLSRWHNEAGDEMPGTYNFETGYYETQWGYTVDSQTGYVINTSEQFDLNGDLNWLKGHKKSCENALEWLIRRDSNNNGLFEMMNDSYLDKKCSDWLDVVYASFENAFVNAQLYEALKQWASCELILGDSLKANKYNKIALVLKKSFNKNVTEGGFWNPDKKCYIYWRDKDGTPHGDNLVTPVAFEAIAFGICDNQERINEILSTIETRMINENLFHWPLCFDSFKQDEVERGNWPFPNYENGDIFTSWGYLGVKSYLKYDPGIALKYVTNILDQYNKDGLSSQRFSRKTQTGIGSDILAGNCTTITALYKDIYGVRPKWNRMGLEPNLPSSLNETEFTYNLRGIKYTISLTRNNYELRSDKFAIKSNSSFGAEMDKEDLHFFAGNTEEISMSIHQSARKKILFEVTKWNSGNFCWTISPSDNYRFTIFGLTPNCKYLLRVNDKSENSYIADAFGKISVSAQYVAKSTFELIKKM